MTYFPDSPTAVSPDFLKKIDQDPPGTWIAQPKFDGWRRCAWSVDGKWTFTSKKGSFGDAVPMPKKVTDFIESWDWKCDGNFGLDMEWIGHRMKEHLNGEQSLIVFDVLLPELKFSDRIKWMMGVGRCLTTDMLGTVKDGMIDKRFTFSTSCPMYANPGLFDRFQEQMTNPLSEGLVVRRADSRHLMGRNGCLMNPTVFKVKYRNIREVTHAKE